MTRTRRTIEGAEDEDEERGALLCFRYLGHTNAICFCHAIYTILRFTPVRILTLACVTDIPCHASRHKDVFHDNRGVVLKICVEDYDDITNITI